MRRQKFRRLEMKTIEPFSRRNFLISSVALAGGVAFGSYAAAQEKAAYLVNPLASDLGPDSATFNAWVKISPEKITLITPHSDSGQGIVRSEEHTSELQSLMRISYAVFCLQKKKK